MGTLKTIEDNLGQVAKEDAQKKNMDAFTKITDAAVKKVATDYANTKEKKDYDAKLKEIEGLDTKIKNATNGLPALKATAKKDLEAYNAKKSDKGLEAAKDKSAKAVTDADTAIKKDIDSSRLKQTEATSLKQKAEKKLSDMEEATNKDNFDKAKEALYGTAKNRATGAQAKMNKALEEFNDVKVTITEKANEIEDNVYTFLDSGKKLDAVEKAKARKLVTDLLDAYEQRIDK